MSRTLSTGNIFGVTSKLKLSQAAVETEHVLQQLLEQSIPEFSQAARSAILYDINDVAALNPRSCPRVKASKINSKEFEKSDARILVFNQVCVCVWIHTL